jgi:hypothetical protein
MKKTIISRVLVFEHGETMLQADASKRDQTDWGLHSSLSSPHPYLVLSSAPLKSQNDS